MVQMNLGGPPTEFEEAVRKAKVAEIPDIAHDYDEQRKVIVDQTLGSDQFSNSMDKICIRCHNLSHLAKDCGKFVSTHTNK